MTQRSYRQFCPLAYSMDLVGERWTLLIVREMLFGPRRFKDIMKGLPGIGSNLLSNRLKKMEEAGILQKQILPPPAGSTVYGLTPRGEELRPSIAALAEWGLRRMKHALADDFLGVVPTVSALVMMFNRDSDGDAMDCEIKVSDELFRITIDDREIAVAPGTSPSPDIAFTAEPKVIVLLLGRPDRVDDTISAGKMDLTIGDISTVRRFFGRFHPIDDSRMS